MLRSPSEWLGTTTVKNVPVAATGVAGLFPKATPKPFGKSRAQQSNGPATYADPPAKQAEPRFEVEFGIDGNKRLLITVRDLVTKQITLRDHPVVRLT